MTDYTSLEISRRLAEAGFCDIPDRQWVKIDYGQCGIQPTLVENDIAHLMLESARIANAYRADTLLAWLLDKGWDIDIGQLHKLNDKVVIDAVLSGTNQNIATEGSTLCDALGEVVIKVREADHDQG
jgi:hypothetical protein